MTKFQTIVLLSLLVSLNVIAQTKPTVNLLVRSDDMALNHASNIGCEMAFTSGISKTVEVMVPCPWFLEAAQILNKNKDVEVGIHLVLNSEWNNYKWRPLTHCPNLVDSNGYFLPSVWEDANEQKGLSLNEAKWDIKEIETEMRAQIEMALKHIPQINHFTSHMGFIGCNNQIKELLQKLAIEYKLINAENFNRKDFILWDEKVDTTTDLCIKATITTLNNLKPGNYIFVDHPSVQSSEMDAMFFNGYNNASFLRNIVTQVLTNKELIAYIKANNINIIRYSDLAK